jgi:hypothetical protein
MLLKISKVIAVSVLFAVPIAGAPKKLDYARILHNGCSIEQLDGKVWRAYVWADYQDGTQKHDFSIWLSQRSNRWKAFKDCDDWLTSTDKKRAEALKPNGQTSGQSDWGRRREGK